MNNNNNTAGNLEFLDIVNIVQLALSFINYRQNSRQTSNDEILKELNKQDNVFFMQILKNQEEILKNQEEILKELGAND